MVNDFVSPGSRYPEMPPAEKRGPLVTVCRCCNQPIQDMKWFDPQHPKMQAKWLVTCRTPGCALEWVTASDDNYIETTDQYPPYSKE